MASQRLAESTAASPSMSTAATAAAASASAAATTCTSTYPASAATTIFSLTEDDLREIFLRLPDLPSLVRAALTCRPWLHAVRSCRPFRRLFRALHPGPLMGLFLKTGDAVSPSFLPLPRSDPIVTVAVSRGDFFLTSLPPSPKGWILADCRHGYVLLWNGMQDSPSVAALNPMTWAVSVLPPVPGEMAAGGRRDVYVLGFNLLSSEESPWTFRVTCVCSDRRRVRAAVFSWETSEWAIGPWVPVGGRCRFKFMPGTLVGGSVFWPYHLEASMIRIDTATMDVFFMDLPPGVRKVLYNIGVGETRNGELCIVHASDFVLHVWVRRPSVDGAEIWTPQATHSLGAELDRITHASVPDVRFRLQIMRVRSGLVHLSTTCMTRVGTLHCWFFSFSLETMELELLLDANSDGVAHLYNMAWPPSLVGDDDEGIGQE
uniref:Uncharacterized protein n=1 Tax=Avena sativa TaxID=4498 RepID=A0ACD5XGI3_AVESA